MTEPLSNPKFQIFDSNGDPLAGGKVYSYEAGTSTAKATYSNAGLTTANTNPIILNSRGEADVYLASGATKLVVKTAADVTVWTLDNISTGTDGGVGTILITGDTTLTDPGYISDGTIYQIATGVTLTINGYFDAGLYQIFSCTGTGAVVFGDGIIDEAHPEWWGGVANGTTDSTAAINAACASYEVVALQSGVYKVTSALSLVGNQTLFGKGKGTTAITATRDAVDDSFNVLTNSEYLTHGGPYSNQKITIRDLTINAGAASMTGIEVNPYLAGYSQSWAGLGIALTACEGSLIENVDVNATGLGGILVADTTEVTIRNCHLTNIGYISYTGIELPVEKRDVLAGCNGISIAGSTAVVGTKPIVENCLVDTFRDVGINVWSTTGARFANNIVIGTAIAVPLVTSVNGVGIGFSSEGGTDSSARASFVNCHHLNCVTTGFYLSCGSAVSDCSVLGTTAAATFDAGFKISANNVSIVNSKVHTQGVNCDIGIRASMDVAGSFMTNLKISDNVLQNCVVGIDLRAAQKSVVSGNLIDCNSIAASYGIKLNVYDAADTDYACNSVIRGNTILKAIAAGMFVALMEYVTIENNTILGAGIGFHIYGANYVIISNNITRRFEAGGSDVLVPYGVQFEANPASCQILDNVFEDYNNTDTTNPYGMTLTTTGTAAFVRHSNTMVAEETLEAKLVALAGSIVFVKAAGPAVKMYNNDDGATSWVAIF